MMGKCAHRYRVEGTNELVGCALGRDKFAALSGHLFFVLAYLTSRRLCGNSSKCCTRACRMCS